MKINRIKSVLVEKDKSQTWLAEKLGKSFCPVKTAAEGLKRLVETKKVSRNVNYEAIKNLL